MIRNIIALVIVLCAIALMLYTVRSDTEVRNNILDTDICGYTKPVSVNRPRGSSIYLILCEDNSVKGYKAHD